MPDNLTAALDEIRERWSKVQYVGLKPEVVPEPGHQPSWLADIPRLLGALDESRKLADTWAASAVELDQMAERADARGADPMRTIMMSARAQGREDCARELREAIARALLGEESGDGR